MAAWVHALAPINPVASAQLHRVSCSPQAIAAVVAALEEAGTPPDELLACLAPVDLAAGEHRFYEAFALD